MEIREVNTKRLKKVFLEVHVLCNKNSSNFIRPLDRDVKKIFDPNQNIAFQHGNAKRWILFDQSGQALGRIAAFTNKKYKNIDDKIPIGGIGFFDCINDYTCAKMLFDKAHDWLQSEGMGAMDGPINFGERNLWWGLLVEGFDEPVYGMHYNPGYYRELFERYGFKKFYNQICWELFNLKTYPHLPEKFYQVHQKIAKDPNFKARRLRKSEGKRFARDFCEIYNDAWSKHESNKILKEGHALLLFKSLSRIMDEDLVWFVYYREKPIAMWLGLPDINQVIRHLNGKLHVINMFRFAWYKWRGVIDRIIGINFGIASAFQGKGIDYYMIVESEKIIREKGLYNSMELQWQGDFNPKILNLSRKLGAIPKRRLVTYRYLFDREAEFHRHPILN